VIGILGLTFGPALIAVSLVRGFHVVGKDGRRFDAFALFLFWAGVAAIGRHLGVPKAGTAFLLCLAGLAGAAAFGFYRWHTSASTISRWARRSKRHGGMASRLALLLFASRWAMLRKARACRPSLRGVSLWRLLRTAPTEFAVRVCKIGRMWAWVPIEDVTLSVGGPRVGKSVRLVPTVVDAPGAVLVTSTRTDLLDTAAPARARRHGEAALVFNPSGVGGIASSVKFSPLHGCRSAPTAYARAEDMIGGQVGGERKTGDREMWEDHAKRILAILLHAAALGDKTMLDVQRWVAAPTYRNERTGASHKAEVLNVLAGAPNANPALAADYAQFLDTNDRTRTSISTTIMPALGWLRSDTALASTDAGGDPFDVAHFLETRGQLFLLGAQDGQVAPLIGAFTGYVAREARKLARLQAGGRLDPPLTCVLDEATLVPVPLDDWTADMGGSGISIHIAVQGRSQLERTWGKEGAATILNNSGTVLVFGGARDKDDLETWSTLSGHREDDEGRRVPVLSPAEVSQLPPWRVLAISRSMPASIGRVPKSWRRRDIRKAIKAYRAPAVMETRYADLPDPEGHEDGE
jgi:type IV secretion system protein VirD4